MSMNANDSSGESRSKIAQIALHDAILSALTVYSGGGGVMMFDHLNVFIEKSFEQYEVWSCRADLLVQDVAQVSLDGPLPSSDYVSDGSVIDVTGREVRMETALEWAHADKVEVTLSSSAKLLLKVSRVKLSLVAPLKKLEDWSGPLTTL